MQFAWASLVFVALTDLYVRLVASGAIHDPSSSRASRPPPIGGARPDRSDERNRRTMADYESHDYDVIVIGAGGAGLRAAIEAKARGLRTALVCKSLLGKAHTVMAEGGVAAAMGNVYPEDNWQVHFRDTMRGGKMLNNWRMAQLHAQEAPDRVYELEAWGALFDRTEDGRILQRDFGGHRYARLAHVGDRTGPRADPHPPAEGRLHGHRRLHGVQGPAPPHRRRGPDLGRGRLLAARPGSSSSSRPRRSCWPPARSASAGSTPPTAGSRPATATPWPCGPGPT